jgi:hypothetical protein
MWSYASTRGGDRGVHVVVKSSDRNDETLHCRKGINDFSHDDIVVDVLDTHTLFKHLLDFVVDVLVHRRVFTLKVCRFETQHDFVQSENFRSLECVDVEDISRQELHV